MNSIELVVYMVNSEQKLYAHLLESEIDIKTSYSARKMPTEKRSA